MKQTSPKIKEPKERVSLTINKSLYETFRQVSDKYMQPRSAIVQRAIKKYVEGKI